MWLRGLTEVARGAAELVFPNACSICSAPEREGAEFGHGLCTACRSAVTDDPHDLCSYCAATVGPFVDVSNGCPVCRDLSHGFDAAIRLGAYGGTLRDAILRMKHSPGEGVAELLGRVAGEARECAIRTHGITTVVPIPLHWRREWSRGYNQAGSLAREIGALLGVPVKPRVLKRVKPASQHAQPSAAARRENGKGAFRARANASVARQTILLVDDVMTTGSTASEAAKVLKAAGAAKVVAFVLARR